MVGGCRDQGDSEGEQEAGSAKSTPTKGKGLEQKREARTNRKQPEEKRQREEEGGTRLDTTAEDEDSEDGELLIADDEAQDDEDKETDEDSDESDDPDESQQFTGTMTRGQSKQLKEAGDGLSGSAKKRNRTCQYCGVVKATPAALVRHIRKHTGERPFVCKLCGKAYKAKRSLNLHENTQHNGINKNPLPTQVPQDLSTSLHTADHIQKQASPTPPISESTKSLLRETLESSRKAKDGSNTTVTETASGNIPSIDVSHVISSTRASERLSTPNLVNLLTTDISTKMEHSTPPVSVSLSGSKSKAEASGANYIVCPSVIKPEVEGSRNLKVEGGEEEQAQDLSIHARKKRGEDGIVHSGKEFKCEFCHEPFKSEKARAKHTQVVHGIITNTFHISDNLQPHSHQSHKTHGKPKHGGSSVTALSQSSFTKIEPRSPSGLINLSLLAKHHTGGTLSDLKSSEMPSMAASFSSFLTKKIRESHQLSNVSPSPPVLVDAGKGDGVQVAMTMPAADIQPNQEETNALPYYITSRMMQDFNAEELALTEVEKTVLAEDGGHRKCCMTVTKETVLATRLDGINNITGRQATVYKCQLCKRIFSSMMRYNNHIPSHYDTEITTYDCRYCEASFRSHIQIIKHLQCHREKFVGFNQPYTDETHHQKKKSDQHGDATHSGTSPNLSNHSGNGIMNLSTSVSPGSGGKNSTNTSPQPGLEPGEKINGGYPCGKCRKSFTREYLLQRHMRIHQNQSSFYCPDCESGFSGEVDLMEHRKRYHEYKATDEQHKYHSLLSGLQSNSGHNHLKQPKTNSSDSNNNSNGINIHAVAASTSSSTTPGVDTGYDTGRAGLYPLVDMKAIDLRHGEEVAVRMMEGLEDKSKQELLKRAMSEEYSRMMLKKAAEMTTFFNLMAEKQQLVGKDGGKDWQAVLRAEQMRQALINAINEEELRKRIAQKAATEEEMRRALVKKMAEEQQIKQRKEDEKKRKLEQAQLKEKLAKEGMGDVTVVLPVAPSPDTSNKERITSDELQSTSQTAKAGESGNHQNVPHSSASSSRIDEVLEKEYGQSSRTDLASNEPVTGDKKENGGDKSMDLDMNTTGVRRSLNSSDAAGGPPAKSRRKAFKPQKINHFTTEDADSKKMEDANKEGVAGSESSTKEEKAKSSQPHKKDTTLAKNTTDKGKTEQNSDAFSTLNGLQHLLAIRNSSAVPASDLSTIKGKVPFGKPSLSPNTVIAGYDMFGQPILYNSNASNSGDEGDSMAIDLSTESQNKNSATSAVASNKSSSPVPPSSSSLPPVIMSYDVDSSVRQELASDHNKGQSQRLKSFSRSISLDRASFDHDSSQSQEYTSHSSPETGGKSDQQLNFKLSLTPTQFSKAMLNNASTVAPSFSSDTNALIGLPRVLWGSSSSANVKSVKNPSGVGKTNGVNGNKGSRASSPSPVPSPTNSDTSSADGRKITSLSRTHSSARATSLSRTHSRLSVVNEPVDRNALCKPKVIENGKAVYSCAICSKNFLSLSDINRHMDFHEDIRPYKCKYCDYYARTNSQLKVHKLRHEGVREFCCRVCNYRGVTQSDLNRHMKSQVHLLRSNHICTQCGEGFVTPKTLQDHMTNTCTGNRMDFDKSFEHGGKSPDDMDDLGDMDEVLGRDEDEDPDEEEEEVEGMDLRIVGLDEPSSGKEMKVVTV